MFLYLVITIFCFIFAVTKTIKVMCNIKLEYFNDIIKELDGIINSSKCPVDVFLAKHRKQTVVELINKYKQ